MNQLCRPYPRRLHVFLAVFALCTAGAGFSNDENQKPPSKVTGLNVTSAPKMPAALAAAGFGKFAAAIKAAGLTEALEEDGPFTCFAPTDAAFDAMPDETKKLLKDKPAGEQAQAWIKYHFVKGAYLNRSVLERVPGANGFADKYLRVWVTPGKITINRVCEITRFDIEAGNGIIHEVNRVLDAADEPREAHKKAP